MEIKSEKNSARDDICEYCGTNHRDENWSLVPCFESLIGTICVGESLSENGGRGE